jgi:hypothetical protein
MEKMLEQKWQLKSPKPNSPLPSTKKGRFSSKNVSYWLRFTTAGSTSTCPKSGLMVASRVSVLVSSAFTSPPTRQVDWCRSSKGLPGCDGRTKLCRASA